jgi:hypothetical protein
MYIALETVILEDVFGRDNQYLKGHEYDLIYTDWETVEINGRHIQSFNNHYLLSNEHIEKYFKYEEPSMLRGSRGNRVFSVGN